MRTRRGPDLPDNPRLTRYSRHHAPAHACVGLGVFASESFPDPGHTVDNGDLLQTGQPWFVATPDDGRLVVAEGQLAVPGNVTPDLGALGVLAPVCCSRATAITITATPESSDFSLVFGLVAAGGTLDVFGGVGVGYASGAWYVAESDGETTLLPADWSYPDVPFVELDDTTETVTAVFYRKGGVSRVSLLRAGVEIARYDCALFDLAHAKYAGLALADQGRMIVDDFAVACVANAAQTPHDLAFTPGDNQLAATWQSTPKWLDHYEYRVSTDGGDTWFIDWTETGDPGFTIGELDNGTELTVQVVSVNPDGVRSPIVEGTATPVDTVNPGPPANLLLEPTDTSIAASWDASPAADVDHYQYRVSDDGGSTWSPNWTNNGDTDVTISSLYPGTAYRVQVRAVDDDGNASTSIEDDTTTTDSAPATPTGLVLTPGDGEFTAEWDANSEPDFDHYQYRVSDDGGSTWSPDWTDNADEDVTVTGLDNGTEYTFEVRAVDAADNASSAASDTVTPASAVTYDDLVFADTPVAYYKCDETSGTTLVDSSGNGNDATGDTIVGDGSQITDDGTKHWTSSAVPDIGGTDSLAFATWSQTSDGSTSMAMLTMRNGGIALLIGQNFTGAGHLDVYVNGAFRYSADHNLDDGNRHFIYAQYKYAQSLDVFVDGVHVAHELDAWGGAAAGTLHVGANAPDVQEFNGKLDHLAYFPGAPLGTLTNTDPVTKVIDLYNADPLA